MTWEPGPRRWRKFFKGTVHIISCRQLNVPETKEGSYQAANAWWQAKRAEIIGRESPGPQQHIIDQLEPRKAWYQQRGEVADAARIEEFIAELKQGDGDELHPSLVRHQYLGDETTRMIWRDRLVRDNPPTIAEDQTIKAQAERWLSSQAVKVKGGGLAPGTWRNNTDCLAHFRAFIGDLMPVTAIDEDRLEAYFNHLFGRIPDSFSSHYALKCFGAAKKFIRYCVEKDLIPFPKNFESRDFRFNVRPKLIPTLTIDEFWMLFKNATGQMPLHLLLMANCGFTQVDIAELRDDEVDWKNGRIIRKRSKTDKCDEVPVVNYKLWPETFTLLQRCRSRGEVVLLTENGGLWAYEKLVNGKLKSTDNIASKYKWLKARIKEKEGIEFAKRLKDIRKTSSTLLGGSEKYGRFAQYFLGQSPRTVADRYYVAPSQELFDEAMTWLGDQYRMNHKFD